MSEDETKMVAEIAKQSISGDICDGDGDDKVAEDVSEDDTKIFHTF